ncbi:hypothetical protein BXZ70DRAFT_742667 [Cristinia sonorae]|uniref:Uncharacterized protein n=1 Tax=Cristinia sonorae TaxID=1940300 RepID=A0A8K0UTC2_9AGAR|nr:hypothetical protein BXZ70DRAFT_742667 [Cristinia sonorae]
MLPSFHRLSMSPLTSHHHHLLIIVHHLCVSLASFFFSFSLPIPSLHNHHLHLRRSASVSGHHLCVTLTGSSLSFNHVHHHRIISVRCSHVTPSCMHRYFSPDFFSLYPVDKKIMLFSKSSAASLFSLCIHIHIHSALYFMDHISRLSLSPVSLSLRLPSATYLTCTAFFVYECKIVTLSAPPLHCARRSSSRPGFKKNSNSTSSKHSFEFDVIVRGGVAVF